MTVPQICLSSNGGSSYLDPGVALADTEALNYVASGSYAIRAKLDSLAGTTADDIVWSFTTADDINGASLPAMTRVGADVTFNVPRTGGAWLLKVLVNNDETLSATTKICVRNAAGLQQLALGETTEAGSGGWLRAVNEQSRALAAFGSVPTGTGIPHIVSGAYSAAASLIVNADVHASAGIVGTKIVAQFTGQTVTGNAFSAQAASPAGHFYSNGFQVIGVDSGAVVFGNESGDIPFTKILSGLSGFQVGAFAVPAAIDPFESVPGLMWLPTSTSSTAYGTQARTGTNTVAYRQLFFGGRGTGTGTPGTFEFYLADTGVSGVTPHSWNTTPVFMLDVVSSIPAARAIRFAAVTGTPWNTGRTSLSVAGSGAYGLVPSGSMERRVIEFTGTLSGDRTVELPVTDGATWRVRNRTTGPYLLTLVGGSVSVPLGPGQSKEVYCNNFDVNDSDPESFTIDVIASLIASVGNNDAAIAKTPTRCMITAAWIIGETTVVGGTSTLSLGVTSGGAELIAATAAPAANVLIGDSELGSDLETTGKKHYPTGQTLYLRNAVATADVTVGSVRVRVLAVRT